MNFIQEDADLEKEVCVCVCDLGFGLWGLRFMAYGYVLWPKGVPVYIL